MYEAAFPFPIIMKVRGMRSQLLFCFTFCLRCVKVGLGSKAHKRRKDEMYFITRIFIMFIGLIVEMKSLV